MASGWGILHLTDECPNCGSRATRIYRTLPPPGEQSYRVRYHRCRACGHRFRSTDSYGLPEASRA